MIDEHRHLYLRGILLGALLLAVVANLGVFPIVEYSMGSVYSAVNRYDSADLVDLAAGAPPTAHARFNLSLQIRRWARGADIWTVPGYGLIPELLAGLSDVGAINSWDGEYSLDDEELAAIEAHAVARGEDRAAGEFTLAVVPEDVEAIVAIEQDGHLFLVDARLLERFDG